jgi:branched-chain amino acid transport system substrate-binding protein
MRGLTVGISLLALASCAVSAMAADTTGVTKDTIKIGMFAPYTGSNAVSGKAAIGVEAVYRDLNDSGGIHGRKIELVKEDSACDPMKGIAAVKKLIAQDKVFMIHGGVCSIVVLAAKDEIIRSGLPYMVLGAASNAISTPFKPNIFHAIATTDSVGRTMVDFAMSKPGTKKIAIVSHSDDWGKTNHDPQIDQLRKKYDVTPVLDIHLERGTPDATPQVLQIKNSGAEFVLANLYAPELAVLLRDAYKYGVRVPIIGNQGVSVEDTSMRVGIPAAVENLYAFYPYLDTVDSPAMAKWVSIVKKYFPNERVETISFWGMGGVLSMIKALKAVGPDLTREALVAELNKIRGFETGVHASPVTFTPDDHVGVKGGAVTTLVRGKPVVLKTWADKK